MLKTLIFLSLFSLIKINLYSQSITIDNNSIGFIVLDDSIYNGTGFNLLKPNYIVTCAHVIDTTIRISFISLHRNKPIYLKLIKYDLANDLALLESNDSIVKKPLQPALIFNVHPSQHLFYLAYNVMRSREIKTLQIDNAFVSAVGKQFF